MVGRLKPNDLGLFDMHGNVSEWCQDFFNDYPAGGGRPVEDTPKITGDPLYMIAGRLTIVRGGSFRDLAWLQRSAQRFKQSRELRSEYVGFRVARTLPN